jgi:hypothetical protein
MPALLAEGQRLSTHLLLARLAAGQATTSRAADPAPRIKNLKFSVIRMAPFLASMAGKT